MKDNKKQSQEKSIFIKLLQEEDDKNLQLYLYLIKTEIKRREIKYAESI